MHAQTAIVRWSEGWDDVRRLPSRRRAGVVAVVLAALVWLGSATAARAQQLPISEYPTAQAQAPYALAVGSDGGLWFTDKGSGRVGRLDPASGQVVEHTGGLALDSTWDIAAGPDGSLWVTEFDSHQIARVTTGGIVTEFGAGDGLPVTSKPGAITAGPGGYLWFTENRGNGTSAISRINPATGQVELASGLFPGQAAGITVKGTDIWFTAEGPSRIGRYNTTTDQLTFYTAGLTPGSSPAEITVGPDGALWFTEFSANRIGRLDPAAAPSSAINEFPTGIQPFGQPWGITTGPDGAIWFTEGITDAVVRMDAATKETTPYRDGISKGASLTEIINGPAGDLWVSETTGGVGRIGRIKFPKPQCSDFVDNDADGKADHPADPGCDSAADDSEADQPAPGCPQDPSECLLPLLEPQAQPQCSDAADNDLDGRLDWPADPGCSSPTDGDETDAPSGCQLTAPRAGRALSAARLSRAARVLFEGPKGALVNRVARKRFRLRVGVYGDGRTRAVKRVAFLLDGKRIRARVIRRRVRGIPVWYTDLQPTLVSAGGHSATAEVTPRRGKPSRLKLRLRAVDCPPATFSAKIGTRGHGRKPVNLRLRVASNGPPLATVKIALPEAALAQALRRPSTRGLGVLQMNTAGRRVRYPLSLPRNRTGMLTLARKGSVRMSLRQGRRPVLLIAGLPDKTVSADVRLLAARARLLTIANPCAAHAFKATLTGRPTGKVAVVSPTAARRCRYA